MLIGVDATCGRNNRGYGRHARALLNALVSLDADNRYTMFVDSDIATDRLPARAEVRVVNTSAPAAEATVSNGHRSLRDMWRMSRAMSDSSFDVLLFPTVYSYVPVLSRARKIVMIHDVIAETYPRLTLPSFAAKLFWRTKVAVGRWQANAIATVSDYSRQGILEHFKTHRDRVFVVGEASDPIFRVLDKPQPPRSLRSLGITETTRTIVYVGGFSPHKNLDGLIKSFSRLLLQSGFSDVQLVMVGEFRNEVFHSCYQAVRTQVEALGITENVVFTGYLSDADLVVLLNLASVLVLPSLIEGFGLPAVEAAACGCPVIATTASPLPGLLGEGGIYINPANQKELDDAIFRVMSSRDLRQRMQIAGREAAAKLTWQSAARQMMELIRKVAEQ